MSMTEPARLFAIANNIDTDDWYTPAWIFDALNVTFDIDVAAPDGGVDWVPCKQHYTVADDGLNQKWNGLIWCNPPYSDHAPWCRRMVEHGNGCILVRADLSVAAIHHVATNADAMWIPKPRLAFVDPQGVTQRSVNFSTVMFGFGEQATRAVNRLGKRNGTTRHMKRCTR